MGSVLKPVVHILLFLLLGLIATVLSERSSDPQCADVTVNFHECADVLRSGNLTVVPPTGCCNALRRIKDEVTELGVQQTCLCVQNCIVSHIFDQDASIIATLDANAVDISTKIQSDCDVNLGFCISTNYVC